MHWNRHFCLVDVPAGASFLPATGFPRDLRTAPAAVENTVGVTVMFERSGAYGLLE